MDALQDFLNQGLLFNEILNLFGYYGTHNFWIQVLEIFGKFNPIKN
jgi:hypothetical protein